MIRLEEISPESVVIVDFGLSAKFKATEKYALDDKIGTILFMAPEQISNQSYGKVRKIPFILDLENRHVCMWYYCLLLSLWKTSNI